jgi:hypothetical protein
MPYSTGMRLVDRAQVVWGTETKNWTGAASDSDWVSLKNAGHATIIIKTDAWAGGTAAITLQQATAVAGTSAKALSFAKMWTNSAAPTTDTYVETAVVSDTFTIGVANSIYIIEVDAASLDITNSFDCINVHGATPGSNADFYGVLIILPTPLRYAGSSPPSAITD